MSNVQYSGCEAIATYNALNLIGTYVPFSDVISTYKEMFLTGGGLFLSHGIFGAMPTDIASSLKRYGVEYSVLFSADEINEPGVYISHHILLKSALNSLRYTRYALLMMVQHFVHIIGAVQ